MSDAPAASGGPGAWLLRRALRVVAFKDSQPFRQAIFEDLTRHRPAVRLARSAHALVCGTPLASAMIAGYGLKSYLALARPRAVAPVVAAAAYRNEGRQFDHLARVLAPARIAHFSLAHRALFTPATFAAGRAALSHARDAARAYRLIDRWARRHDFLVACRLASTLGYYLRFARELRGVEGARAALVSSDSNPYAMGLAAAARRRGLPVMYVTHGHIPDGPPPLDFELSILDGPAVLDVYRESGPVRGRVVYKGAEGEYRPMSTAGLRRGGAPRVGVFLSLMTDWPRLATLLDELRAHLRPARFLVRLHPNELVRPRGYAKYLGEAEVSRGERVLLDDAAGCDVVFAANSSCHLSVLKYGVPTVHLQGMDAEPHDFYRFIRRGILPDCERVAGLDLASVAAFYEDPEWPARFALFDASYPARDADADADVRAAVSSLLPGVLP